MPLCQLPPPQPQAGAEASDLHRCCAGVSFAWRHTACESLSQASVTWHVFQVHPSSSKEQVWVLRSSLNSLPSSEFTTFCLSSRVWSGRLCCFYLWLYEQSCCEHPCTGFCADVCFSASRADAWVGWLGHPVNSAIIWEAAELLPRSCPIFHLHGRCMRILISLHLFFPPKSFIVFTLSFMSLTIWFPFMVGGKSPSIKSRLWECGCPDVLAPTVENQVAADL